MLKIYHIKRNEKESIDYDEYSDYVVIAENEKEAREMGNTSTEMHGDQGKIWDNPSRVDAFYLGRAKWGAKKEIVISSFHAG